MTRTVEPRGNCQMGSCPFPAAVFVAFGEWGEVQAFLCDLHKPTVEQALRRGVVVTYWTVHGYYPAEIAGQLSAMTGHTIRESTVRDDLRWLGLTEAHRAAEARLGFDIAHGKAGPNVVALRKPHAG
jgi:hypothetical protein